MRFFPHLRERAKGVWQNRLRETETNVDQALPGVAVFDEHTVEYDRWFDEHKRIYEAELSAVRTFIPGTGLGIEVGVGTGRFAVSLGIKIGVEPSRCMARIARDRGLGVCQALGEQLPFRDGQFDFLLLVTVICFVDDVINLFREVSRVLASDGRMVLGFIDRNSAVGRCYEFRKETSTFYRNARFYSTGDVVNFAQQVGFRNLEFRQTIFDLPDKLHTQEEVRNGHGDGAFVVLSAQRKP